MIAALAPSQTLAWASSNYLVAIVADSIARDLSTSTTAFTLLVRGSRDLCSVLPYGNTWPVSTYRHRTPTRSVAHIDYHIASTQDRSFRHENSTVAVCFFIDCDAIRYGFRWGAIWIDPCGQLDRWSVHQRRDRGILSLCGNSELPGRYQFCRWAWRQ